MFQCTYFATLNSIKRLSPVRPRPPAAASPPPSPRVAHLTKASRRTVGRKRRECTADKPKRARPCGGVSMERVLRRRTAFGAVAGRGVGLGIGKLPAGLTFITADCWVPRGSSEGRARRRPRRSCEETFTLIVIIQGISFVFRLVVRVRCHLAVVLARVPQVWASFQAGTQALRPPRRRAVRICLARAKAKDLADVVLPLLTLVSQLDRVV